ncbi:TonB-dependent receptor [uncultured Proteiniphilum sp.]|uniref:TonB-dependent receptor n=1 Tax=uncultured Proteiniphilum sp. TaxID=497637 RepID=UPI00260302BF|nr:TonB-dependent receptor [uncultured Proteiniphilum sp.]
MKDVLSEIEKNSEFIFIYEDALDLNKKVSINAKNENISNILNKLFESTDIQYIISDRQIAISKKGDLRQPPSQQNIRVTGTVSDNLDEPLPGVTIIVRGTAQGTTTDTNGEYSISVPNDTCVLQFSYIGFTPQEIVVGNKRVISVNLSEETTGLDEVVVVGFGKQKKTDVVGSVTSIKPAELKKVSSSNMTTMLAGNIAGMISYQRSGEPGADNADFFIRGVTTFGYKVDPLILIDGIEVSKTDLARMQPDDIENFSIMKDATSTAVYGARGANGVISITTKEGKEGKLNISVRFENAFTMPTKNIELADPITYMNLGNEAVVTRDPLGTLTYSKTKIDNTIAGTNKYVYPATDWQNELLNDYATTQRFNLNASGGGKVARYYLAATFNQDNGILKVDKRNNFNNNIRLRTYSFRSNVNFNLTRTTEAALKISGTFDDYTGPIHGGTEVYRQIMRTNPVLFPPYYEPDETYKDSNHILFGNYGTGAQYINPYAEMVRGYKDYSSSKIDAQFELTQDFSFITEGLSFRALFNTSRYAYFDVSRYYNPYFYTIGNYNKTDNTYMLASLNEGTEYLGYSEGLKDVLTSTYIELMTNYNRTFNETHTFSGMMVYTMRNELKGNAGNLQLSLPKRNLGLSGRATYSYRSRYFGEFNFGYNGSERFHKKHRFGFFPSAGLAWTLSNEEFWNVPAITNLKFRATYGLVGNDAIGRDEDRFFYLSNVDMNSASRAARFGTLSDYIRNGVLVQRNANEDITWEIARKTNIGFELGLFGKLTLEADYFHEYRTNILMTRSSIPTTMGLYSAEMANVGEAKSQGIDGSLDYTTSFGKEAWLRARANFTYATNEFLAYEEPNYKESYRQRVGHPIQQQWGYIAERLFIDETEVSNSPEQFGIYGAGDIKYHDVNQDGRITSADMVPIGYPTTPEIMYGFGISGGYKNLDVSFFFQGSARSSFWIDIGSTSPFYNETQLLKAYADSYWSEENQNIYALWPRLSTRVVENNNQRNTWFMRDGSFLRLKSVEIGYTLPANILSKLYLSNARIYFNTTNPLCFSKFKLWDVEMGGDGLGYPIQKSYNIGLNISF